MITGEMWTRFEWGVWWSWEPRLTTYLILMLIVIAYFVLRSSVDEPERRATFAAVVAIIATIDVPICFMITRLIPSSIHPVVLREGGMSPEMGMCVGLCALGMMLVGAVGMKLVPPQYFGVVERFSVFAATGFNAALGIHLFREENAGETQNDQEEKS